MLSRGSRLITCNDLLTVVGHVPLWGWTCGVGPVVSRSPEQRIYTASDNGRAGAIILRGESCLDREFSAGSASEPSD